MSVYRTEIESAMEALSAAPSDWSRRLERIRAELRFADLMCQWHPAEAQTWREGVLQAGAFVRQGLTASRVDVDSLTAHAEAILAPLGSAAKSFSLLCIGHAHIDMNWQWAWPETVALTNDTFQTMLALMAEFPGFLFSQSQASVYALIEKYNPAMFEQIRERVKEGRWEVTASQWVEGDKNMASGESIVRHLLYTRAYIQARFDLAPEDVPIGFEPDTFGHAATVPTLLAQGGVRYYYHCRGSRGPHLYWWIGPDGARLLTLNDIQWYMHFDETRHVAIAPNMADPLLEFCHATGLRSMPVLYGVGDHGGGPTRRDLRRLMEMDTWPVYPRVEFSTLRHFFEIAETQATRLPEVVGERNFIFPGCYTSQARQKEANRHSENLLYASEALATLGHGLAGVPYPQENYLSAWRSVLFDQFHDILPGSGVRATRYFTLGHAQDAQAAAGMARSNALRALVARINTAALRAGLDTTSLWRAHKDEIEAGVGYGAGVGFGAGAGGESGSSFATGSDRAFVLFNPLPHPRSDVIEVKLWDTALDLSRLVVTGEGFTPLPAQVLGDGGYAGHHFTTIAFPVQVPALGYRAVCVSDRGAELGIGQAEGPRLWDGIGGAARTLDPEDVVLENEFLMARIDPPSGSLVSLVDKRTGRDWVPQGQRLGVLQYCLEANQGMTSWVIGQFMRREDLVDGGRLVKLQDGPHVKTFRWTRRVGDTSLQLDISLSQGAERIDFRLRVDWREVGDRDRGIPHLKLRFPLAIAGPVAHYEIPFGSIRRDLFDGEEVPAQRWVDLSESDGQGVTLVNTSKYGFSVEGSSLNMTLLRASIDPDPLPDLGEHIIEYALAPHGPGWTMGLSTQVGEELNAPLVPVSSDFHNGDLPLAHAFVEVEPDNVRVSALKLSEDGRAIIVRLIEAEGVATSARVRFSPRLVPGTAAVTQVDLLERPLVANGARMLDGVVTVPLVAHGIVTLRVVL